MSPNPHRDEMVSSSPSPDSAEPAAISPADWAREFELLQDKSPIVLPSLPRFLVDLLTIASMVAWSVGLMGPTFAVLVSFYYTLVHQSSVAALILATLLTLSFLPVARWPAYTTCALWRLWREYFEFKLVKPRALSFKDGTFLFAEYPHGVFPMGQWLSNTLEAHQLGRKEGDWLPVTYFVGASMAMRMPVMRQLYGWFGGREATKESFLATLREHSCAVIPGGIAEMFLGTAAHDKEIVVGKHKGFVKLAIQAGTDLIPVYHLGNSQLWHRVSSGRGWLTYLSRKLRFGLVLPFARWYTPIPYRHPVVCCFGNPVRVTQNDNPSSEEVERVHALFMEELTRTYYAHRHLIPGWESRPIVVM